MHIALDVRPLETGHQRRGIGVYTKNLIEALQKYEKEHSYTLFTRGQKVPASVDIVHYPYFDSFFLTLPVVKPKPTVVTVHDLIPLKFPDKFPPGIRGSVKWQIQKFSLMGARRIMTDSKSSKHDVSEITGYQRDRIDVVYLAPNPALGPSPKSMADKRPYVLYVGDVNWNKNILNLLNAFHGFRKKYSTVDLVLVGAAFRQTIPEVREINRLVSALGLEKAVLRTGKITDKELSTWYTNAQALVLPSIYEGFGLPILEAFACGCPVVAADTSSLAEIAGPAIRVQTDEKSIQAGMELVMTFSDAKRKTLIAEGKSWVKAFTWKRVAREVVATYERALS